MRHPDHLKGLIITVGGVLILSPDGMLISLISADAWTILFWRNALMAAALAILVLLRHGRATPAAITAIGLRGVAIGALFGLSTVFFVTGVRLSSVATVLFIISTTPLFAALYSRVFLGERVPTRTWGTILVVIAGMALIFVDAVELENRFGAIGALIAAASWAGIIVILRHKPIADPTPALALGAVMAAVVATPLAATLLVASHDILPLAILGLFVLPVSFALISQGPKYLPAPEVSLIMLLEAVAGPIWAWAVLTQIPEPATLIGGTVILLTLMVHFAIGLRRQTVARST